MTISKKTSAAPYLQFTAARWLRSRFQRRYLPPVLTYAALLAVAGVPLLAMHPLILVWAPLYAVCAGVSFLCAWLRRERSLWANAAAVIATSMMAYVVYAFDAPDLLERTGMGLALAGIFMLTQFGSVLYVKTMIRNVATIDTLRRHGSGMRRCWRWPARFRVARCRCRSLRQPSCSGRLRCRCWGAGFVSSPLRWGCWRWCSA